MNAVEHPSHYNVGSIEVIDAIEDWCLGFHLGSVVKYIARAPHKGKLREDLTKALWYLHRFIANNAEQPPDPLRHLSFEPMTTAGDNWKLAPVLVCIVRSVVDQEELEYAAARLHEYIATLD